MPGHEGQAHPIDGVVLVGAQGEGHGRQLLLGIIALGSARATLFAVASSPMKRIQLQLPDPVLAWVDAQADGLESRAAFLRRSIVSLMKADLQRRAIAQRQLALQAPAAMPVQPLPQAPAQPAHPAFGEPWASL